MMINITYYFMSCIYASLHKLNYIIVYIVYYAVTYGKQQVYVSFIIKTIVGLHYVLVHKQYCVLGWVCKRNFRDVLYLLLRHCQFHTFLRFRPLFSQSKFRSQPWTVFYNLHVVCPAYMIGRINDQQRL